MFNLIFLLGLLVGYVRIAHLLLYKIMIYSFLSFPFWPGSGPGKKHADPDPKPWCFYSQVIFSLFNRKYVLCIWLFLDTGTTLRPSCYLILSVLHIFPSPINPAA